jgi:hypothetical protein
VLGVEYKTMKKDWTGNSATTFATLGASSHSSHKREENDYYATDPKTIEYLFNVENFTDTIWEPACGEGHLSKAIELYGKNVLSTDLIYRGYGSGGIDFLKEKVVWNGDIITNPPYKYAQEFVEHSMELIEKSNSESKVAMFLKLTFLEGQKRKKLFQKYPPKTVYVFSQRQKCAINGDFANTGSSAACYAWFIWEKGYKGETIIRWI